MPTTLTTQFADHCRLRRATPGSAAAPNRRRKLFPSGITHDSRYIEPTASTSRGRRAAQMDVDGAAMSEF